MNSTFKPIQILGLLFFTGIIAAAASLYFDLPASFGKRPVSSAKQTYTCPMHPEVVQDHAGNCSKCGMALKLASASSAPPVCGSHGSGCCSEPAAQTLTLPPGHPPIDGYPAPVSLPGCTDRPR